MYVVYVQVNDKNRMYLQGRPWYLNVLIKEGFISILLTPER